VEVDAQAVSGTSVEVMKFETAGTLHQLRLLLQRSWRVQTVRIDARGACPVPKVCHMRVFLWPDACVRAYIYNCM